MTDSPTGAPDDGVRVVVVDDHPLFLSALRAMIDRAPGLSLVGAAEDGHGAVAVVEGTASDVVLMDLRMPGMDGVEATRRVLDRASPPAVLVLTMAEEDATVFAAVCAGARGYLLKGADEDEIVAAIRLVAAGGVVLGPTAAAGMIDRLRRQPASGTAAFPELTAQEHRVLELLAGGRSTAGIAAELHLSTKTIRNHLSNTYAKLQVTDRWGATLRARERGLGR